MKFAHMSDVHLGVWSNHPELKELAVQAFEKTMNTCMEENVDFIVISGDLFDTSLPPIDVLKRATARFRECREAGIRVYAVAGSHDFSPTGKTMLGVLEEAGLIIDVSRHEEKNGKLRLTFRKDRSGAMIAGISGKKGALDSGDFENLERDYDENGFRIFMFHAAISEYKPAHLKDMKSVSLELLPKNFDYYAAGHIHMKHIDEKNRVFFPGSLFPCDFGELEKDECGFYIVEAAKGDMRYEWRRSVQSGIALIELNADGMKAGDVERLLAERVEKEDLENRILLIKLSGALDGRQSDISFRQIVSRAEERGAVAVKRNIHLTARGFEEIKVRPNTNIEQLEREVIRENPSKNPLSGMAKDREEKLVADLMGVLKDEKQEDETISVYEERIKQNAKKILEL